MALSEHEKALLDGIGARLDRDDPELARRLSRLTPPTGAGWRPPKAAVIVALVLVAGAAALIGGVTLTMNPPCAVASARADPARTASPVAVSPAGTPNC